MQREKVLEHALRKFLRLRNDAIKSLYSSVRRFRDATIKEECKGDYPHALQASWKALDRAENLIQTSRASQAYLGKQADKSSLNFRKLF